MVQNIVCYSRNIRLFGNDAVRTTMAREGYPTITRRGAISSHDVRSYIKYLATREQVDILGAKFNIKGSRVGVFFSSRKIYSESSFISLENCAENVGLFERNQRENLLSIAER